MTPTVDTVVGLIGLVSWHFAKYAGRGCRREWDTKLGR